MRIEDILKEIRQLTDNQKHSLSQLILSMLNGSDRLASARAQERESYVPACPKCTSKKIVRRGRRNAQQRYQCKDCNANFSDTTGTFMYYMKRPDQLGAYIRCMLDAVSINGIAKKLSMSVQRAFDWRHKILQAMQSFTVEHFKGIVEMDELYVPYSQKGERKLERPGRKRGSEDQKRGISNDKVNVLIVYDRSKQMDMRVGSRGYLRCQRLNALLAGRIDKESVVCSDKHKGIKAFIAGEKLSHVALNSGKKEYVKGIYHIQHVNSTGEQFRFWLLGFRGVASRYLQNYASWFTALWRLKTHTDPLLEFMRKGLSERGAWQRWRDAACDKVPEYLREPI